MTTHSAHTTDLPSAVVSQPSMGHEDGDLAHLPLNLVQIDAAHNPRSYFEDEAMRSLIESVRENGIIQPITVRPNDDEPGSYHLIAGERRLRAAKAVGLTEIPAIVRLVDADQAHVLATIENTLRDDMSPAEEAQAARKILALCGGDREGRAPPADGRGYLLGRAVEARACLAFNQNVRGLAAEATLEDALATIRPSDPHCDGLADFPAALGAIASHDAKFREDLNGRGWPLTVGGVASALDSFIFTNIEKRDAARRAVIEAETAALRETLRTQQVHQRDVDEASQGE